MTTKDSHLPSTKSKQQSFEENLYYENDNIQYINLNLNQNGKGCSDFNLVQSKSNLINDKKESFGKINFKAAI